MMSTHFVNVKSVTMKFVTSVRSQVRIWMVETMVILYPNNPTQIYVYIHIINIYTYIFIYIIIHTPNIYIYAIIVLFIDLCIYVFIFLEAAPIRSGPPGVDAVVSRPHGGHHRNASTEELDHQVVGGRDGGGSKISKS
jgi:hypothetical protein